MTNFPVHALEVSLRTERATANNSRSDAFRL
jgi:hypothetical protein